MTKVPLALEGLTAEEIELVCEVFRSGNLTMGERVLKFEQEFAEKFKTDFAIMVNSGSSANLLPLEVLRTITLKKSWGKRQWKRTSGTWWNVRPFRCFFIRRGSVYHRFANSLKFIVPNTFF